MTRVQRVSLVVVYVARKPSCDIRAEFPWVTESEAIEVRNAVKRLRPWNGKIELVKDCLGAS